MRNLSPRRRRTVHSVPRIVGARHIASQLNDVAAVAPISKPPALARPRRGWWHAAGGAQGLDDLGRMNLPSQQDVSGDLPTEPGLVPVWVERHLVISDEYVAQLMPASFPTSWLGVDFEAHGLPIGLASTLSFAIRWHGDRPAVLWEVGGAPMPLTHDSWTTGQLTGEALWPPVTPAPPPDTSFT